MFYPFRCFVTAITGIPIKDLAVQHLHPTKPELITSQTNFFIYFMSVVIVQMLRLLIMWLGGWAALLFLSILLFSLFSLSFILRPDFKSLLHNK